MDFAWDGERFKNCRNGKDLRRELESIYADVARVLNVTLLCGHGTQQKRLCIVDFVPSTVSIGLLAERMGGKPFGHGSIVLSLALASDFECPRVPLTPDLPCSCTPRGDVAAATAPARPDAAD